jgi:hypothetical protein
MRVRSLLLAAALVATLGLATTGTGGVDSTAADREVGVVVVADDAAYLGFEQDAVTTNGTTNLSVTVANRFPAGTTLTTVAVTVEDSTEDVGPLGPGDEGTATFEFVDCDGAVLVVASGDGAGVELAREECG